MTNFIFIIVPLCVNIFVVDIPANLSSPTTEIIVNGNKNRFFKETNLRK